ncbi:MAG: tRNA 2-thiouridine(34) synthase MnmA [Candidatus Uhrbacteria bacterium]|nr:tRNA 2-thiouridine(34) synthase MnmA [Candidatus Uhrbacteria bacterium]
MTKPKVLLGMSGGVDSSVSAVLLLERGFEVIGGFMKNWSDASIEEECSWRAERRDAMRVAAQLGIPFHTFDFENEYRKHVYEYMISEYKAGRTPNPDVLCNKYMKFDLFMKKADELGCEVIATGHYAQIEEGKDGKKHLMAGADVNKDQSYFLCQLNERQIARSMFPIGHLKKSEVRAIAHANNLIVAGKKDSQGICFVGKVALRSFLSDRIPEHQGKIVTTDGRELGFHQGFEFYTVGQRGGLGVGGGVPFYVVERRPETNEVVVAVGPDDPALLKSELTATQLTETIDGNLKNYIEGTVEARIRYRQPLATCIITPTSQGDYHVKFDQPQRAVAPGQFIAFYKDGELLGSGVIADATASE